jgi:hypothetical protein
MHRDLLLPTPWLDSGLCSTFVQSASKLASAAAEEHPSRKPLLAEHVLLFLRAALFSTDLKLLRAVVAVTLAFLTFARGASVMGLVKEDVQVSDKGFEVRVWDEQTRKGAGIARSIAVSIVDCPLVGQVVLRFVQLQAAAFGPTHQPRGFVQLPGEPFPLRVSSTHACSSVWQLLPWMGCTGQPSRGTLVGRGVSVHCMPLGAATPVLLPGGDGHLEPLYLSSPSAWRWCPPGGISVTRVPFTPSPLPAWGSGVWAVTSPVLLVCRAGSLARSMHPFGGGILLKHYL